MATYMGTMLILVQMPMAARAAVPKGAARLLRTVLPTTFSRFWMEAGTPTPQTPRMILFSSEICLGDMLTQVVPRFTNRYTRKYPRAHTLEMQVARPAPAAPISKPQGRMKMGSSTMLRRHPLMVPMLA